MSDGPFKIKKSVVIKPVSGPTLTEQGEMAYDSSADKLKVRGSSTTDSVVTEAKAQDITAKTLLQVDNLQLDANTLSSTNSNGNIIIDPNGTGSVNIVVAGGSLQLGSSNATVDDAGNIVGVSVAGGNIKASGNSIISTNANGDINLTPNGTGKVKVESGSGGGIDVQSAGLLEIGASVGANNITVGGSSSTVVIPGSLTVQGTATAVNTTNTNITDALITLNKGGGAASAAASGIEFEEASSVTGYIKTSGDRNSFSLKAPNTADILTLSPGGTSTFNNNIDVSKSQNGVATQVAAINTHASGQATLKATSGAGGEEITITSDSGIQNSITSTAGITNGLIINQLGSNPIKFKTAGSDRLTIAGAGGSTFSASLTVSTTGNSTILTSGATTSANYMKFTTNSGAVNHLFGVDDASGSTFGYSAAYSLNLGTGGTQDLIFFTNNLKRLTIASGGAATFTGDITGSLIHSNSAAAATTYISLKENGTLKAFWGHEIAGGSLATGTAADSSVLTTNSTQNLHLGTNSTSRLTINGSTGNVTLTGTITTNGIVGDTSGAAMSAGEIGEFMENSGSNASVPTTGLTTLATITLTTGVWLVSGSVESDNAATQTGFDGYLIAKNAGGSTSGKDHLWTRVAASQASAVTFPAQVVVVASGDANKTVAVKSTSVTANGFHYGYVSATRCA